MRAIEAFVNRKIAGSSLSAIFVLLFRCGSGGGILPAAGDATAQ